MQREGAMIWRYPSWRLASAQLKGYALATLVALAVFAILLAAAGKDPLRAYADTAVYVFGNAYGFSELLVRMVPLIFTAIAVALPARIGLINVGGEGQLYMGAWLATAIAEYVVAAASHFRPRAAGRDPAETGQGLHHRRL